MSEIRLLNEAQAADYLGLRLNQFRTMVKRGEIPTLRMGRLKRFTIEDLELFVRRKQREARAQAAAQRKERTVVDLSVVEPEQTA